LVQLLLLAGSAVLGFLGYQQRKRTAAPTVVNKVNTGGGSAIDGSATLWGDGDFVGRDKITVILAQSARHFLHLLPKSSLSREALQSATESYLRYLLDRHRFLNLKGLGVSDRVPLRLPLLELYVPLKARLTLPEGETWRRGLQLAGRRLSEEEQEALTGRLGDPQPVLDLLQKHDGLIILGDPGAGKTTFLKVLALNLALGQGEALGLNHRLPVLLPLSAYANALAERDALRLDDFIATYLHEIGSDLPIADLVAEALRSGQALILLDGLDEVKNPAQRHTVVERVVDFYTLHRRTGNKFVLTSRIVGYREARPNAVPGLAECTLVDFEEAEITDFVTRWTRALERQAQGESAVAQADAAREREELLEAIDRNPGVRRLAANPLLLTILAVMKRQGVILPERRVELYDQYVKTLLSSWNRARGLGRAPTRDLDVVQTVRVLAPLALWMHEENPGVGLVKREALRRRLEALFAEQQGADAEGAARQFLADVREHAGLLLERGPGEYGFIHLTFEEYLSAVAIALRGQGDCRPIVDYLSARVGDAAWREVALLTVPYLGIIQQLDRVAGEVVEALVAEQPGEAGAAVVLAGQAMLDAGKTGVPVGSRQVVTEALVETLQSVEVAPVLRREAGLVLGKLGWEPEDLDTFMPVPAGPFLYGNEKQEITQPYWIGKYPVTNAQYARFVEAGGYRCREFWSAEGWAWREKEQRERPGNWQDARFDNPIFPVVGVTQYEAAAYCTWLTAQLQAGTLPFVVWEAGQLLTPSAPRETLAARLPAEEEWERAARGVDGREYPWEGKFDYGKGNIAEKLGSGIGTTAVCTYPQGVSPVGAWDMSGNVWEWTAPEAVLRGGSWNNIRGNAQCAYRNRYVPVAFNNYFGFRVVVSLVRG
jgi:formylglycine-generating enzyme required for sulfatase activity